MRIKIFQIDRERDTENRKFRSFDETKIINPAVYKNVYYGDVDVESLEDIYTLFNDNRPSTFQGHSLSVSDVVEICDNKDSEQVENGCYFCDSIGFKKIDFDTEQCAEMSGIRVVYVTPGNTPIDIRILSDLHSLQNAVDGLIEPVYTEPEGIILVGNDEAKLRGMKGNRHIGDGSTIIAGPFFVCGDDGENFISLTDEQAEEYMGKFAEPEQISDEEVQADAGFTIHIL